MRSTVTYPTLLPTRAADAAVTAGATEVSDLPDLGTVLGVWAHPDDEAYLSSGLVLHARATGQRVVVVTATDGELGGPADTRSGRRRLAATRRRELAASLRVLGVEEHHRLGYADGSCASVDRAAAVERVAAVIQDLRPDTIVTFGPDGMTGHLDHRVVGSWTVEAAALAGHRGRLWFPTLTPEFHRRWSSLNDRVGLWMDPALVPCTPTDELAGTVRLTGEHLERKMAALAAQASQTAGLIDLVGARTYAQWWGTEWFRAPGRTETVRQLHPAGGRRDHH
jgi:LmbE family N-acetylglucosaminyl deacetylase